MPRSNTKAASSSSDRNACRQFISKFRFTDNSLATFSNEDKKQILNFQKFISQTHDGFCCICLRVLYPQERRYRVIEDLENLRNCTAWKMEPLKKPKSKTDLYMVCVSHQKTKEAEFPTYVYPGNYTASFLCVVDT